MGFFDRFKKRDPAPEPEPFGPALRELAELIAAGDEAVRQDISACTGAPAAWFEAHRERYEERSVGSAENLEQIQWLGLVDILEEHGWVCERDWKDELEDFLFFVRNLQGFQTLGLTIEPDWLNADGDIPAWCDILTEKWSAQGIRMAAIDIDSDSYVLFPVPTAQLSTLQTLSERIGQRIDFVENM